jgi:hypothetical protein
VLRRFGLALIALSLGPAATAGAQALPTTAVIGTTAAPAGPTAPIACGPCVVSQAAPGAGEVLASPFAGTITSWTATTTGTGTVALLTLRVAPGSPAGIYTVVGATAPVAVGGAATDLQVPAALPVLAGDIVAVQATGSVGVVATTAGPGTIGVGSLVSADAVGVGAGGTRTGVLALGATVTRTPVVTGLTPSSGPVGGGVPVTITGHNLDTITSVTFGTTPASSFTVVGPESISAIAPPGAAQGAVAVTVAGSTGATSADSAPSFGYLLPLLPPPATTAVRCVVPDLRGRTLPGARRLLARAHCRLGAVSRSGHPPRRVVRQSPSAGAQRGSGARVRVRLRG